MNRQPLSDNILRRTGMNRQPLSDNILRRTGMNRQPLGDTDSSYVTLCDAMKHHIATTVQIVQHIHSITFPPHMLILQKGYYDMMTSSKQQLQYFNPITPLSMSNFTDSLTERLQQIHTVSRPIILVCIGSDRATGDSLGPFVGHELLHPFPTDRRQSFAEKRNSKTRFSCKKGQYPRTVPKSSHSLWNLLTTRSAFQKVFMSMVLCISPVPILST